MTAWKQGGGSLQEQVPYKGTHPPTVGLDVGGILFFAHGFLLVYVRPRVCSGYVRAMYLAPDISS